MKRKWIICGLIVIIIVLAFFVSIPVRTETKTISIDELNVDDPYLGELSKEIRNTIHENSGIPVSFGKVYILRAHYLLGNDKVVLSAPYIATIIRNVGKGGTSDWTFMFNSLTMVWNGDTHKSLKMPFIKSCKCNIEADLNTSLDWQGKYYDYLEVELNSENQKDSGEYALSIGAATKDSAKLPNSECSVSAQWDGNLLLSLGVLWTKSIPFEVTASAVYFNNI